MFLFSVRPFVLSSTTQHFFGGALLHARQPLSLYPGKASASASSCAVDRKRYLIMKLFFKFFLLLSSLRQKDLRKRLGGKLNGTSASIERDYLELLSEKQKKCYFSTWKFIFLPTTVFLSRLSQDDNKNLSFQVAAPRNAKGEGKTYFVLQRRSVRRKKMNTRQTIEILKSFIKQHKARSSTKLNIFFLFVSFSSRAISRRRP